MAKFEKKNTKVPEGYSLNADRKKWRLRVKKEGGWESLGRFDTEQAAIDFAVQAGKFAKQSTTPAPAAVKPTPVPEVAPTPVADKKAFSIASPLERLRTAVRESPKEIPAPVAVTIQEDTAPLPVKAPAVSQVSPQAGGSRTEILLLQSRVAQLQKDMLDAGEAIKAVSDAPKEVARIRDNLRSIIEEKTAPLRTDVSNLRGLVDEKIAPLRSEVDGLRALLSAPESEPAIEEQPEQFWKVVALAMAFPAGGGLVGFVVGYFLIKMLGL